MAANDKNVGMGGKCFVGAREAAEGQQGHVTRVDDVTVRDSFRAGFLRLGTRRIMFNRSMSFSASSFSRTRIDTSLADTGDVKMCSNVEHKTKGTQGQKSSQSRKTHLDKK